MKHLLALVLATPLLLAGCVEPVPPPVEPVQACGADELQYLVGKPGVVLDGMRFSQELRVIQPGMAVTMDFKSDRLNIWLDERDVIIRVVCG
jgi:Peptidase inhibitor I78 family